MNIIQPNLDEPREHRAPHTIDLASLILETPLDELDLPRVERGAELGHERAVEGVA